jgi:hypothetical protein
MRKKADFCDYAHVHKLGVQKSVNPGLCACANPSVVTVISSSKDGQVFRIVLVERQ